MKKHVAATAALALTLTWGTSVLAANPFSDVPAKHWSYDAVAQLVAAGIVDGYGDGTFKGDKTMTRYEMAMAVAKAIAKEEQADTQQKAVLEKLTAEYASELDNLGVRVSALENKIDNVTFNGKVRTRYDHIATDNTSSHSYDRSHAYLDLYLTAKINDTWKAVAEMEGRHNGTTGASDRSDNTASIWVTGPVGDTTVTAGKFELKSNYGFIDDTDLTGVKVDFGNRVKTSLRAGHFNGSSSVKPTYRGMVMKYKASQATNLVSGYHHITTGDARDAKNIVELGFDSKFAKDLSLQTEYLTSNVNTEDKGYLLQLQYKAADSKKDGTYDIFVNYKKAPYGVLVNTDASYDYAENFKGWQAGFDYVPMTNAKFTAFYQHGKVAEAGSFDGTTYTAGTKIKAYRAQLEFSF